jgi:hypothetical protein
VDATVAFGKVYIANGVDPVRSWNVTTTTYPINQVCTLLEFQDERIWCASDSYVKISSIASDSYFTPPAVLTQANQPGEFFIARNDGDTIRCLVKTPWGMYVGKRNSSFIIKGYDSFNYTVQVLDPQVGCVSDRSFQMLDGLAYWLAVDGVYAWDGAGPPVLASRDIEPTVRAIRQSESVSDIEAFTTQADWQSGLIRLNGAIGEFSTTILPDSLTNQLSSFTDTTDADWASGTLTNISISSSILYGFGDPALAVYLPNESFMVRVGTISETNQGFEQMNIGDFPALIATSRWFQNTTAVVVSSPAYQFGNRWVKQACSSLALSQSRLQIILDEGTIVYESLLSGTTNVLTEEWVDASNYYSIIGLIYVQVANSHPTPPNFLKSGSFATRGGKFLGFRRIIDGSGCPAGEYNTFFDMAESTGPHGLTYFSSGTFTSRIFDTQLSTQTWGPLSADIFRSTNGAITIQTQVSTNAVNWSSPVTISNGQKFSTSTARYARYIFNIVPNDNLDQGPFISSVSFAATSTGTYTTPCIFLAEDITGWGIIDFDDNISPASRVQYQVRSSSFCALPTNESIPYVNQTNHAIIAASTNSFLQVRAISSIQSTTETWILNEISFPWLSGLDKPVASGINDHRYFLSVATSPASTNNDLVLVLQKHKRWTFFNGPSYYSMGSYDDNLLAGDSSSNSKVWKTMRPGIFNDDGAAIRSTWITKDFSSGFSAFQAGTYRNKSLNDLWLEAGSVAGSSVTVSVANNGGATFTDMTVGLGGSGILNRRIPLPAQYLNGRYFKFKMSNLDLDKYFKIHGIMGAYEIHPLRSED